MESGVDFGFVVYIAICIIPILVIIVIEVSRYGHKSKIKNLKNKGEGIMKKAKISAIRDRYIEGDTDVPGYYLYRLEASDEAGTIYKSEEFKKVKRGGHTLEEMKVEYDGVSYDLGNRDEAIKQINDNINRLELELQNNPWIFKKIRLKQKINTMNKYIEIANEGPTTPYLIINGLKISVGDTIDVFVNPNNSEQYYFDLDFTKEK